jgi:AcrR family transcriptional regulator
MLWVHAKAEERREEKRDSGGGNAHHRYARLERADGGHRERGWRANGSLFTYFETKTDLFNQLYLELKTEMASAATKDLPTGAEPREQLLHLWQHWMNWAVSYPEKRRALAQLGVSEEITLETRAAGHKTMAGVAGLLEQIRGSGPMRKAPMGFVVAIMNSVAEATIDFMTQDSTHARKHCKEGFKALWRMVA